VTFLSNQDSDISKPQKAIKETAKKTINIPETESNFISSINNLIDDYKKAPNEMKKSAIRTMRGVSIQKALNSSFNVSQWIGKIKKISTNGDGKGILEISLEGTGFILKTWNNALSDMMANTLIPQNSDLFNTVSEMEKGQRIIFSGNFFPSDKNDFVQESSMTEYGSMSTPEFIFRFNSVVPYLDK